MTTLAVTVIFDVGSLPFLSKETMITELIKMGKVNCMKGPDDSVVLVAADSCDGSVTDSTDDSNSKGTFPLASCSCSSTTSSASVSETSWSSASSSVRSAKYKEVLLRKDSPLNKPDIKRADSDSSSSTISSGSSNGIEKLEIQRAASDSSTSSDSIIGSLSEGAPGYCPTEPESDDDSVFEIMVPGLGPMLNGEVNFDGLTCFTMDGKIPIDDIEVIKNFLLKRASSSKKYFLTLDIRKNMFSERCFGCQGDKHLPYNFFKHCIKTHWYCDDCYQQMPEALKEKNACGHCTYCLFKIDK